MTNSTQLKRASPYVLVLYCLLLPVLSRAQPVLSFSPAIATSLNSPVDVLSANDGTNRIFIVERTGAIKIYDEAFAPLGTLLTVTGMSVFGGEQGLLSMAFHPNYASNRFFFVHYTNAAGDVEIARYQTQAGNANVADPASKTVVLTIVKPQGLTNHNGGKLNFGPDGYLYFGTGDGGGAGDERNYAQRGDSLLGKMLRINVSTGNTPPYYTIPADNPYVSTAGVLPEIFAFGLRNPWRWSFDRSNGDMWIADVGQGNWEEVNFRTAATTSGINYGWHCYEGTAAYNTTGCLPASSYVSPIFQYPHNNATGGFAITGGYVYRGSLYPSLAGYYITADYLSDNVWLISPDGGSGRTVTQQTGLPGGIVAFGETESGELLSLSLDNATLYTVSASSTLPVTLLSFTARAFSGYNELQWQTTREVNFKDFSIEFSMDGSHWTKAGSQPPQSGSTSSIYTFKHALDWVGKIYYRLSMNDLDGTSRYSRIITLNKGIYEGPAITLYPSVNNYTDMQVQLHEPFTNLQVINMHGQVMRAAHLQNSTGFIRVNTAGLSKGVYALIVSRSDKKVSKTFVIP